jgi:hypothetical protein
MPWNGLSTSSLFRADASCMDLFPRSLRMRVFHGCLRRALAGAMGAGLLVLAIPVPSMAAPTPSVTITDVTVTEGTGGIVNANFTIQAAPAPKPGAALQVSWATASVSATAPADFTSSSGTVSLTKNSPSKIVSVPVVGDALNEANETFMVNIFNLVGSPGTIGDAQGVGTITDNDPIPVLSVNDVSAPEGNSGTTTATFTVTLSAASGRPVTFDWATAAGSATAGTDYVAASGSRTIAAGATSATIGITVNGDVADELDETFGITLSNPGNATIGDGSGLATISDDDPIPVLSVNDVSVTEGNAGTTTATFTVTLSAASGKAVTFDWATAAGSATAGTDYVAASGSRTIAAGTTTATVGIIVNGDVVDEPNETFGITLSNPGNATIGDSSGLATITDDDAAPTLSVNDVTIVEGNAGTSTATFTVSLSSVSSNAVTFDWVTAAGSATAGTDYVAASGNRTIAAGSTTAAIAVTVNADVLDELDETYGITLSNPGNATIADGSGLGTITDDDPAPSLSINDVSVTEGNAGTTTAMFTVTLSAASGKAVTFDWASAAGSASAGTDYVDASGSRTIVAGTTTATIGLTVNGDLADEPDETFAITLSNPGNATIADGSGVATITDDDSAPTLSINDVLVTEGNTGTTTATFTVTLSGASGKAVTVDWATADGSAQQPSDYTAGSGTLTFSPGDTTKPIVVTVNGDGTAELDETFNVLLSAASNATLGDAVGIGTIVDDELLPVIDIDEPTALEDTGTITFTVTLSHPSGSPVTVDWGTAAGTATNGPDYFDTNGIVTFAPGDTIQTVAITVNADGTYELDETMAVNLSNSSGPPIGDAQGIGTIANDDDAPELSVGDVSVAEGNTGQKMLMFTVSLAGDTDIDATVDFATTGLSAAAVTDYLDTTGTLTIPAGATTGTVSVVVNGDVTYEPNETLTLTLTDPTGATIRDGVAQGTITNDDKRPTTLTLQVVRKPHAVVAKGLLEPTASGQRVTVTLFRKQGGRFVKIAAKTVSVRYLKDRDGDGKTDGSYTATFVRPKAKGSYKIIARFKGAATYKPCSRAKVFSLTAS